MYPASKWRMLSGHSMIYTRAGLYKSLGHSGRIFAIRFSGSPLGCSSDWNSRVIFNPNSKTKKGRRFVPMSDRVMKTLLVRCADRTEGWVFPSRQKGKHITGGLVNKQWVRARKKAGLPEDLVLYCARHDFGTYVLQKTGNIAAVMNSMSHSDVKTAMTYQHPELNVVRDAINSRHILRHSFSHARSGSVS